MRSDISLNLLILSFLEQITGLTKLMLHRPYSRKHSDYAVAELEGRKILNVLQEIPPEKAFEGSVVSTIIDKEKAMKKEKNTSKLIDTLQE